MKILFIIDNFKETSFNENALSYFLLSKAFKNNKHQILSITIFDKDDAYLDKGKNILYLPKSKLNKIFINIPSIKLLADTLASFKPDVIHVLNSYKLSPLINLIANKFDIPIVKSVSDVNEIDNKEVNEYLVHTEHIKDMVRKNLLTRYINVVSFGINIIDFDYNELDRFRLNAKRRELNINETSKIILAIGDKYSDVVIKGYYNFIIAHPELDVVLLIINNEQVHPELLELSKELNINNKVKFLNKLSYQEIILFYKLASIYIGNKLSNDNIVHYLYALNAMNVIIANYDTNLFSLIKDNENGFYYKDEESLAKALYHVFALDDKKKSEIKNNAKQVGVNYSLDKYYKGVMKVYERAIKKKW